MERDDLLHERESQAVYFLNRQNVTRLDVVNYLSHGISKVPGESQNELPASEENNEDGAFIPGPPFGNANVRATGNAEGFVHVHAGVHGIMSLAPETYDWRNPVVGVTIRRVRTPR